MKKESNSCHGVFMTLGQQISWRLGHVESPCLSVCLSTHWSVLPTPMQMFQYHLQKKNESTCLQRQSFYCLSKQYDHKLLRFQVLGLRLLFQWLCVPLGGVNMPKLIVKKPAFSLRHYKVRGSQRNKSQTNLLKRFFSRDANRWQILTQIPWVTIVPNSLIPR